MERKINTLEHCQTEVLVTFDKNEFEAAKTKAFNKLKKNVSIKGFRKGNAPDSLVKEKINQVELLDEAINSLLPEAYKAIIEEDKVEPYAQPQIEVKEFAEDKLVVRFLITTAPVCELGEYKGLNVGKEEAKVSEEEVETEVKTVLDQNATLALKEGESKEGDTVVIDFEGFVNGEAFEGGKAANYELVLGSHSFIPGFEEQCANHKAGDEFDVNVKFPEQYVENLAGKDATFKIKLHEVKEKVLPELTDEFVKGLNLNGIETVEALKESKKANLLANKTAQLRKAYLDKLLAEIQKNSKVDIPEAIVTSEVESRKQRIEQQIKQSGLDLDSYLNIVGQDKEKFLATLTEEARKDIVAVTIIRAVAEKENIVVGDAELEFEYSKMAEQYNMKVEDVKKALEPQKEQFKQQLVLSQAENILFNQNN